LALAPRVAEASISDKSVGRNARAGCLLLPQSFNGVPEAGDSNRNPSGHLLVLVRESPNELERHQRGAARVKREVDVVDGLQIDPAGNLQCWRMVHRISQLPAPPRRTFVRPAPDRSATTGRKITERSLGWDGGARSDQSSHSRWGAHIEVLQALIRRPCSLFSPAMSPITPMTIPNTGKTGGIVPVVSLMVGYSEA
jgi:hypothetical protein